MMSSTLREMHTFLNGNVSSTRFWVVFSAMVAMFAFIGPFGTFEHFGLLGRLGYWSVTMVGSWIIAMLSIALVVGLMARRLSPMALVLAGSALASLPIALYLQHVIPLMIKIPDGLSFLEQWAYATPIALTFGLIMQMVATSDRPLEAQETLEADNPLLNRLPVTKRGTIQYLSMQDHYVSVTTNKGTELVLMRLGDAIAALPKNMGTQIHRSHWVAHNAVAENKRINGKPHVVMLDGTELPVSRSFTKQAREAGVL